MQPEKIEPIWLITANIVKERRYGPGGKEKRNGTKHFRGGAKVYIVYANTGMAEKIAVIGHHRKSGRRVQIVIDVNHFENFRMTLCYSPEIIKRFSEEYTHIPTKPMWEEKMSAYKAWQS